MNKRRLFSYIISFVFSMNINFCSYADIYEGLVAYYKFEENLHDSSEFKNHGVNNGNLQYVDAVIGKGIRFLGVNSEGGTSNPDYILIKNSDSLRFNDAFSVSYFSKIEGDKTQTSANCSGDIIEGIRGTILAKSGDRSGFYFIESEFVTGFGINPYSNGKGLSADKLSSMYKSFRHTAYVVNGDNIKIYVDGILVKVGEGSVDFRSANSNDLYLGVQQNSSGACFPFWYPLDGVVDELRIYNRVLSDAEVRQIYNEPNEENTIVGKIVSSAEILGYTASVGGASVTSESYNISAVTNIYGEFSLTNMPEGINTLQITSSYFTPISKTIDVNSGINNIGIIEIFEPNCQNHYSQEEVDKLIQTISTEKDQIILEKDQQVQQLNDAIASMYTQGDLDQAVLEAEKRGELKYDINKDGKVGLEEVIRYLETISGVRVESLIIFPNEKKHYLTDNN